MIVRSRIFAITAVLTTFAAAQLAAQSLTTDSVARSAQVTESSQPVEATVATPAAMPVVAMSPVGVQRLAPAPVMTPKPPEPSSQNTALMVVGGAGLIVGAVVGGKSGTLIMVGGAVVGLWGLYQYMR